MSELYALVIKASKDANASELERLASIYTHIAWNSRVYTDTSNVTHLLSDISC